MEMFLSYLPFSSFPWILWKGNLPHQPFGALHANGRERRIKTPQQWVGALATSVVSGAIFQYNYLMNFYILDVLQFTIFFFFPV